MTWGIQTWDASGVPNNYGIKPVTVVGIIDLALFFINIDYSVYHSCPFSICFAICADKLLITS